MYVQLWNDNPNHLNQKGEAKIWYGLVPVDWATEGNAYLSNSKLISPQ